MKRLMRALFVAIALASLAGVAGAQMDLNNTYYVPQAGAYGSPIEGTEATTYFRACPNNDGGASLPLNARIMVVVRDAGNNGISGISAADICMLFNGGTAAQGFTTGSGADSVIANSTWNPAFSCPDVRCVQADGPTDVNGVTFITFTGAGGVRDPNRKWGHYDTVLPVTVLGTAIQGRLTPAMANGSYVLRIKNFDNSGGLAAILNQGEIVSALDFNAVVGTIGVDNAISYWRDFDGDGAVTMSDFNMMVFHLSHRCDIPNSP